MTARVHAPIVHSNLCLCLEVTSAGLPCLTRACANADGKSVLAFSPNRGATAAKRSRFRRVAAEAPTLRHDPSLVTARWSRDLSDLDRKYGELQPMVANLALAMSEGIHSSSADAGSDSAFPFTAKGSSNEKVHFTFGRRDRRFGRRPRPRHGQQRPDVRPVVHERSGLLP